MKITIIKPYGELREEAYPKLEDQLDLQYWDIVNSTSVWTDTITAIKNAHPKPSE